MNSLASSLAAITHIAGAGFSLTIQHIVFMMVCVFALCAEHFTTTN
jgi:hypothetical protein